MYLYFLHKILTFLQHEISCIPSDQLYTRSRILENSLYTIIFYKHKRKVMHNYTRNNQLSKLHRMKFSRLQRHRTVNT